MGLSVLLLQILLRGNKYYLDSVKFIKAALLSGKKKSIRRCFNITSSNNADKSIIIIKVNLSKN